MPETDWVDWIVLQLADFERLSEESKDYRIPPSDEPLGWKDTRTKLVRLDVAILALHLMTARVATQTIPAQIIQQLKGVTKGVRDLFVADILNSPRFLAFAGALAALAARRVVYAVSYVFKTLDGIEYGENLVKAIRRTSIRTQREVRVFNLKQVRKRRKTRAVLTRHKSPRQRAPNSSWRNPSKNT